MKNPLEVVSKPQIRFKGPPKADYMSNLNRLMYASSAGRSRKRSPPEADEHLSEACNAALGPQMGF